VISNFIIIEYEFSRKRVKGIYYYSHLCLLRLCLSVPGMATCLTSFFFFLINFFFFFDKNLFD
jgi:hypothetical protein